MCRRSGVRTEVRVVSGRFLQLSEGPQTMSFECVHLCVCTSAAALLFTAVFRAEIQSRRYSTLG